MATRTESHPFTLGGQQAWFHDEGHPYGPIHTYDRFRVGGDDDTPRKVHIVVPRDYSESAERYPVVYMNDGQTAIFPGGPARKSWRVAESLGQLRTERRIPSLLVVAIHPVSREREYTHARWSSTQDFGGLDEYARYLAERVRPWIDQHYRTDSDGKRTAIVGSSHGGLAAFHVGCHYPERFHLVGALSPSFWVGRPREGLRASPLVEASRAVLADAARRPRIWLDWGLRGDGTAKAAAEMAELLQSDFGYRKGDDLELVADPHADHDEDAWASRFPSVLRYLYR